MKNSKTIVELKDIVKIYGEHVVLKKVSFELKEGEIHCLIGENGAGKSTLIKILSGAVSPDSGEIYISGKLIKNMTPRLAVKLGISTVYQDTELVDSLTVAENIFLGEEKTKNSGFLVDRNHQNEQSRNILEALGIEISPDTLVGELSTAQKQMVQIAKALHRNAKVIIFDEPTSSLGLEETKNLMNLVRNLKEKGIGIIYISHYLSEIFELGDRVTILKDGENMGTYEVKAVDISAITNKMVGRDTSLFFKKRKVNIGEEQVQINNLSKEGIIHDVSFSVRKGEIFGIGGLVGSGRTELVSMIFGIMKPDKGEVRIKGKKLKINSPIDAIRNGICFVPEDRKKYAMLLGRNVVENSTIIYHEIQQNNLLNLKQELNLCSSMVKRLSVAVSNRDQLIEELSGGNQQKVILGRWLFDEDAILYIFDEPTKGVGIGAREQIYELMTELAEKGKSIIMVSSDMPELISMSDRIGVMRNGRMIEILENKNIKEEELIKLFIGV